MMPEWFEEWVIEDVDNWHLKADAPEEVRKAFEAWMKLHDDSNGINVD